MDQEYGQDSAVLDSRKPPTVADSPVHRRYHAKYNGSNYLYGHCFVSIMLSIPVFDQGKIRYLSFPVGYRMWTKEKTKLAMAADLVKEIMDIIGSQRNLCLCCDSWYPKADVQFLPLTIYSMRWSIEVSYYEQKKFWALGNYMLRSKIGIERLTNLLTVLYSFMAVLPFYDKTFSALSHNSPQQSRFVIGMTVWHELFLAAFETNHISSKNLFAFDSFCL